MNPQSPLAAQLNAAQRQAISTLRGPLLVLAGAGTGKTRVVTVRIANLIRHGTAPDRILAVTFTNKAAGEMQQRIGELLGKRKNKAKPTVGTFHSHCVQILRRHIRNLGYPENFAIYDQRDQESLAARVLRECRVSNESLRPSDMVQLVGFWKSRSIDSKEAEKLASTDKQHLAAIAYRRYQVALKNAGAVDFDDLLLCTLELFGKFPAIRAQEAGTFDHLLVDEYQDTNTSQYRIVKALAGEHRNLCVVGDDDQSIYGFRGAEVEHILKFARDWPDAVVVRLEENYRCTGEILNFANQLIRWNPQRHEKVLRPSRPGGQRPTIEQFANEEAEAKGVVQDIERRLREPGAAPRDFAVLFRTTEQTRAFESELRRAKIPYVLVGGMSFFDRREVRDVLAFLKMLVKPQDDVSLLRIINTPPRGFGPKTVSTIVEQAVAAGRPAWDLMEDSNELRTLPENALAARAKFVEQVNTFRDRLKDNRQRSLHALARAWLVEVEYEHELQRQFPEENAWQARWANVEQVINALAAYEKQDAKADLAEFLRELTVNSRDMENDKEKDLARNAVVLMTYHSAKGLEFPNVFMVGMDEGVLPHHRSIQEGENAIAEERRLCYVGITRARERLSLSLPLSRMKWGKPRDTQPSRFLFEMTGMAERGVTAPKKPADSKGPRRATDKKRQGRRG